MKRPVFVLLFLSSLAIHAAEKLSIPAPLGIPSPAPATDKPYAPQPILPGGLVIPIYPEGSPFLRADKVKEAEVYNLSKSSPGRINWITNIHNPSIEIHTVDGSLNTGTAVILCAGGGHNTLNVGTEAADFVPFFYNYGINSIILRNRLRKDGYKAEVDAVNDAMQAIRVVRAHAADFKIDPNRIGIMGFSAPFGPTNIFRPCSTLAFRTSKCTFTEMAFIPAAARPAASRTETAHRSGHGNSVSSIGRAILVSCKNLASKQKQQKIPPNS
jgi:hypothetical protein